MAIYITLLNYTPQGIQKIKDSPKRLDAARELARKFDLDLKEFYLTMGQYDAVVVMEGPNDEAAAKFALAVGSLGNVRTTTLRAFSESDFRSLVGALP